jgi:hypothetical protein
MGNNPALAARTIQEFLERDHERLDALLAASLDNEGRIDHTRFDEFRKGLLKHIGIEEKWLFPQAAKKGTSQQQSLATTLRMQHGAIASLLVIEPTPASIRALRHVLAVHNPIEEGIEGFYATCEELSGDTASNLLSEIKSMPEVPVATRTQNAQVIESAKRALVRAGFPASLLE